MTDVSDIEDGFTLKRQRDKVGSGPKKRTKAARGEHTVPPPPVKHILASFTLANLTSKRAVSDYVEVQARENVLHAEKVKSEHILGRDMIVGMCTPRMIAVGLSPRPRISIRSIIFPASISRFRFILASPRGSWPARAAVPTNNFN